MVGFFAAGFLAAGFFAGFLRFVFRARAAAPSLPTAALGDSAGVWVPGN